MITQSILVSIFTLSICLKDEKCYRRFTSGMRLLARNSQATSSTSRVSALLLYSCSLLVCKVTTGNRTCQRNRATSLTGGSGPPPSWLSGGAGSRARCRAVLWKVGDPSLSASGGGGSKGDAEFAQSTHCTVRFTQLFCSQCKYGQPHSSLALLPQHTSRGEG